MKNFLTIIFAVILVFIPLQSRGADHAKKEQVKISSKSNPNIDIVMLDGANFNLQKTKNNITVINFWAYWCGICKSELKELNKLYQKYRDKKVEIVGISIDDEAKIDKIQKIAKNLSFRNGIFDNAKVIDFSRPKAIPETYIIDSKGRLIEILKGETDEGQIEEIILENIK